MGRKIFVLVLILTMVFSTVSYGAVSMEDVKETIESAKETVEEVTETVKSVASAVADFFTDIKDNDWFADAVQKMSEIGIIKGYPDGTFKPNDTVTFAEFVKMFIVAVTEEDLGNSTEGHWAKNYYDKGIELGLYTEYEIQESDLNNEIPREIMAFMVSNNFYGTEIENYDLVELSILDLEEGKPYQHEIIKSYGMGILTGYENGEFKPDGTLTRAESATVINRVLNEEERIIPDFTDEEDENDNEKNEESADGEIITIKFALLPDRTFEKTLKTAKLGDYGIEKLEITSYGYVAIYSTVAYDNICLLIDNVVVTGFGNVTGTSYFEKDGYYIYYAEPEENNIDVTGKTPTLWFLDDETLHKFTDVTL